MIQLWASYRDDRVETVICWIFNSKLMHSDGMAGAEFRETIDLPCFLALVAFRLVSNFEAANRLQSTTVWKLIFKSNQVKVKIRSKSMWRRKSLFVTRHVISSTIANQPKLGSVFIERPRRTRMPGKSFDEVHCIDHKAECPDGWLSHSLARIRLPSECWSRIRSNHIELISGHNQPIELNNTRDFFVFFFFLILSTNLQRIASRPEPQYDAEAVNQNVSKWHLQPTSPRANRSNEQSSGIAAGGSRETSHRNPIRFRMEFHREFFWDSKRKFLSAISLRQFQPIGNQVIVSSFFE